MKSKNNNLVKCGIWMAAAFICMIIVGVTAAIESVYVAASVASLICMAVSMFYWVRFAVPLSNGAFRFK